MRPESPAPAFGLSAEDFLKAGFQFGPGIRLLVGTSVLIGYLNVSDLWHQIAVWLFDAAILVEPAPRMFVTHRVLGEYAHRVSRDFLEHVGGRLRRPTRQDVSAARAGALKRLTAILGPYPLIGLFPSTEAVMVEWQRLYEMLPFDETDALQLANCKVYGFDFLTVDRRLIEVALGAREELTRLGYSFRIYHTPNLAQAPGIGGSPPSERVPD